MTASAILAKTCSVCGCEKPVSEFSKNKTTKDGMRQQCKACDKAARAIYYAATQDKRRAASAAWNKANPDKAKARKAAWVAGNVDRAKQTLAIWRAANGDKIKAAAANYRAANSEARRLHQQNRRSRARGAGGKLSKELPAKLFNLQKGKCPCCKQPLGDDYHLDHIVPLALGGTNTDDNIQLLRAICNQQKRAAHPVDFMRGRGFLL